MFSPHNGIGRHFGFVILALGEHLLPSLLALIYIGLVERGRHGTISCPDCAIQMRVRQVLFKKVSYLRECSTSVVILFSCQCRVVFQ